jgi:hypothetical protein
MRKEVFDDDYSLSLNVCFQIFHGQIGILCVAFREISSGNKSHRLTVSIARELISKHQKIIVFSNKIEDLGSRIENLLLHYADLIYVKYIGNLLLEYIIITMSTSENSNLWQVRWKDLHSVVKIIYVSVRCY